MQPRSAFPQRSTRWTARHRDGRWRDDRRRINGYSPTECTGARDHEPYI